MSNTGVYNFVAIVQTADGNIHLTWDYPAQGEQILMTNNGYNWFTAAQARELAQQLVIAAEHIEAAGKEGRE